MDDLEKTWRCARAMNLTPKTSSPPHAWWVRNFELEMFYSPLTNNTQMVELILCFNLDVQWHFQRKVRVRFYDQMWDFDWYDTLHKAVVSRIAKKFSSLQYRKEAL